MSENKNRPKYSFSKKVNQREFLNVAVWPGRANPDEEVLSIQLRKIRQMFRTAR